MVLWVYNTLEGGGAVVLWVYKYGVEGVVGLQHTLGGCCGPTTHSRWVYKYGVEGVVCLHHSSWVLWNVGLQIQSGGCGTIA